MANRPKSTISWVHEQSVSLASAAFTAGPDTAPGCGEDTHVRSGAGEGGMAVPRLVQIAVRPARCSGVAGAGVASRRIAAAPASAPPATRSLCRGAVRVPVEQRDTRVRCCKLDMGSVARVWAVRGVVGAEVARRVGRDENLDLAFFTLGAAAAPNLTRRNKPELQTRSWA